MSSFEGPFFDELRRGDVFSTAPPLTLTEGRAAVHQSIIGGRLRTSLDTGLSLRLSGAVLADPAFVWDVAIGQSTLVTRRVIANLFYRGLAFHRLPAIGDTLRTRTEVVGLRQTASRPAGLAALRITTRDQRDQVVLDFWRCAMLPLSSPSVQTGFSDDLSVVGSKPDFTAFADTVAGWDLSALGPTTPRRGGDHWELQAGDVVSNAPEFARLTLNLAHVHHDEFSQQYGRLVYGGHTIGIALAQITKALPDLLTVAGWHSCDHSGPVREGDTLTSTVEIEDVSRIADRLQAVTVRSLVVAKGPDESRRPVLDWRLIAFAAS